jgi:SAM-dependent methyltransferase
MARVRPYYADHSLSAAFYDVVTASDSSVAGDVELYAGLAPPGGSALELGAGAGRVAFALAARGLSVTGVDLSPAMLARARTRQAEAPPELAARIDFRQGDMTALDLKRSYDLAIAAYFTLAHLPTGAAWRNAFAVMARHLRPGGRAAVHLPLLELMRLPAPVGPETPVFDEPLPHGGRLQLHIRERRFRDAIGRLDQVIDYVERDAAGRIARRSAERLTYYMADPVPFAEAAGLKPAQPPVRIGRAGDIWIFERV